MKILIDNKLLLERKKINNIILYYLENGDILKTNEINEFKIICDKCKSESTLKIYPTTTKDHYLCSSCRNKGELNPMYGKKWSDELKSERSLMYIGDKNPMFGKSIYDIWINKYGKDIADIKLKEHAEKASLNSKGINNGMYGKTFYQQWIKLYGEDIANEKLNIYRKSKSKWIDEHKEHLEKMIINSHKKVYRKTSIEKEVETFLINNKINYKYNFILNRYQFDFLLNDYNTIIEVQGDYWHANPLYYSDTNINLKKLNEIQKYKVSMDIIKNDFIKNNYNIIYLWETEIKNKTYQEKLWNLLKLKK
jgi:G:T-mismatch repair DNA endonuclease (very short patch repair protein)